MAENVSLIGNTRVSKAYGTQVHVRYVRAARREPLSCAPAAAAISLQCGRQEFVDFSGIESVIL